MDSLYLPQLAKIVSVVEETPDIKTFAVVPETCPEFISGDGQGSLEYLPGQFLMVSVFGMGECPLGISSPPAQTPPLEFTVKKMGKVTTALSGLGPGDQIGIRGPYGNCWPTDAMKGKNLIFIGGGVGLPPLRTLLEEILYGGSRKDYGRILIIYGARSPADLVYKEKLERWAKEEAVELRLTVDAGDDSWKGPVGFVPSLLMDVAPSPENAVALTVGPPIMIKFVLANLVTLGFSPEQVFTNLENRMKCGVGKCGRCNIGPHYVCTDGPVFSYQQILQMPLDS